MRGIGVTAGLADLPATVVLLFALLTQLGDAWFIFAASSLLYWRGDDRLTADPRRTGAMLIAVGLAALAVTLLLKSYFALPRPPGAGTEPAPPWLPAVLVPVFENTATGTGFGFPSGHAVGTTMVYGAAAALYERVLDRRRRVALAAGVVAVVSLSRLVLGVHYLVDVLVGVVVGSATLAIVLRVADGDAGVRRPDHAFLLAAGLTAVALPVAVAGGHHEEVFEASIGLGSAVGGFVGWRRYGPGVRLSAGAAVGALVLTGGAWGAIYALEPPLPVTVLGSAIAVGALLAAPGLVEQYGEKLSEA